MAAESTTKATRAKSGKPVPGKAPRRSGGMAGLAGSLRDRTDNLARRSTTSDLLTPADLSVVSDASPAEASAGSGTVTALHPQPAETPANTADDERGHLAAPPEAAPEPSVGESASAEHTGAAATQSAAPADASAETVEPTGQTTARAAVRRATRHRSTVPRPLAGTEGRLEASGETVVKWTIELAPQVVHALNVWERDETKRLGQRVFRERVVDIALDLVPSEMDAAIALVNELPPELRRTTGELFSTRVRSSVKEKLLGLRPDMRVAGIKDIRMRDIYTAGLYRYLLGIGVDVTE